MVNFEKPFISGNLMKNAEQLDEIVCEGHLGGRLFGSKYSMTKKVLFSIENDTQNFKNIE